MIRLIATGVWVCLVTVVSAYAATLWQSEVAPPDGHGGEETLFGGLQSMKTSLISVPVISNGAIVGYVVAQFTYTMKSDVLGRMSVKPDVFLLDAAFRAIYGEDASSLRGAKKKDLQTMTASIKSSVNQRFGEDLVEDVLIEKFTYVPKDEIRDGANVVKMQP